MPKKIHFNWKTNVSEINNWVFLGSSREIAVLGISSPICGSHPGHQTLSFAQFLKFQSTQRKKGLRTLPWSTLKTLIQIISQKEEHEVKFSKNCRDLPSIFLIFQCCDHQVKSTLFIPEVQAKINKVNERMGEIRKQQNQTSQKRFANRLQSFHQFPLASY